jgi:hypothetical protein
MQKIVLSFNAIHGVDCKHILCGYYVPTKAVGKYPIRELDISPHQRPGRLLFKFCVTLAV